MNYKILLSYFILIGTLLVVASFSITDVQRVRNEVLDKIRNDLNLPFVEGIIDSPSVIIRCNTFTDFKQKTVELCATTIYEYRNAYYVFNKEMTIAWYYEIKIGSINGLWAIWDNP